MISNKVINLMWTGGFDSTYRLLELVLEQRLLVQPHYLIDSARLSTRNEINTMKNIKQKLFNEFQFTQQLILPTLFTEITDIQLNDKISNAYQEIRGENHLGTQYDWLSRYCHEHKIKEMEIATVLRQDSNIAKIVKDSVELIERDAMLAYRIRQSAYETLEGILFRYYIFPIFDVTKYEMYQIAKGKGWEEFINMTWFCHKPKLGPKPCGVCHPCQIAINGGLAFRIPLKNRIIGKILVSLNKRQLYQKAKQLIKG